MSLHVNNGEFVSKLINKSGDRKKIKTIDLCKQVSLISQGIAMHTYMNFYLIEEFTGDPKCKIAVGLYILTAFAGCCEASRKQNLFTSSDSFHVTAGT